MSYWFWWSHFGHDGSISGHGRFPVQGISHGLLPLKLGHVEHTGFGWGFRALDLCMTCHLLALKCISQVFSHRSSFCRSCCKVWKSFSLVTVKYTAVSSANMLTCEFIFSDRSFMYKRNEVGPRTEPWGTPDVTGIAADFSPSRATHCERPSKNTLIQLRLFRVIPCWWSLKNSLVWSNLSKALLKSRSVRLVRRPWERPLASSSMSVISCNSDKSIMTPTITKTMATSFAKGFRA